MRDDEEESLFETAAEQLPEMEIDEIFSQAVLCVETGHSSSDSFMIPKSSASPAVQTFGDVLCGFSSCINPCVRSNAQHMHSISSH